MNAPGLPAMLWHGFSALLFASLAASIAMFGPLGFLASPIAMLYAAVTALPLYALASAFRRPGWVTAALIGGLCMVLPLLFADPKFHPYTLGYQALELARLVLPGAVGGLVFHGIFAAATRPRET